MAFVVNQLVWFKASGTTPFVTGSAADAALPVGAELGGRGKADIAYESRATSGLSDGQGVPSLDLANFPAALDSKDASAVTISADGEHLGVLARDNQDSPITPGQVQETDGIFDGPTSENLFNPGVDGSGSSVDEGRVENATRKNTIRDIDPNRPSGSPATSGVAVASGDVINVGGTQDFVSEVIDLKTPANRVGRRLPSSEENAGRVIEVVTVQNGGKTPDGTAVRPGDKLYWVNWGTSDPSNPHRVKLNNRFRISLHAEVDLVAA